MPLSVTKHFTTHKYDRYEATTTNELQTPDVRQGHT